MASWEYDQPGTIIGGWSAVDDMVWEENNADDDHMVPEEAGAKDWNAAGRRQQQHNQMVLQSLAKATEQGRVSQKLADMRGGGESNASNIIRGPRAQELLDTGRGVETAQIVLPSHLPSRQQSAMSVQMEDSMSRQQSVQMEEAGPLPSRDVSGKDAGSNGTGMTEGSQICSLEDGREVDAVCRYALGDVGVEKGDSELFDGDDEEGSRTNLLTYGWDSINNVDDMEKLFRQNSASCGRRNSSDASGEVRHWLANSPQVGQMGLPPSKAKLDPEAVVQEVVGGGGGGGEGVSEEATALQQQQEAEQRELVWAHQAQQRQLAVQHQWQAERLSQQAAQLQQEERVLHMLEQRQRGDATLMAPAEEETGYLYGGQPGAAQAGAQTSITKHRPVGKAGPAWPGARAPLPPSPHPASMYNPSPAYMRSPNPAPGQQPYLGVPVDMHGSRQGRSLPGYMPPGYMGNPLTPPMLLSSKSRPVLSPSQALHQQLEGLHRPAPGSTPAPPPPQMLPPHPLYAAQQPMYHQPSAGMAPPVMMTPQEKIEKLKWRQQMRFAAEQRQRMHEAQVAQQLLAEDQQAINSIMGQGVAQFPASGAAKLEQSVVGSNTDGNTQGRATEGGVEETYSLEAVLLQQLQAMTKKLNIGTRLCIRDALFRLARSARQRKAVGEARRAAAMEKAPGGQEGTGAANSRFPAPLVETETNPIDRNIANLLFHRAPPPAPPPTPEQPAQAPLFRPSNNMMFPGPLPPPPQYTMSDVIRAQYAWPRQVSQVGTWGAPSSAASTVAEKASALEGQSGTLNMGPPREPAMGRRLPPSAASNGQTHRQLGQQIMAKGRATTLPDGTRSSHSGNSTSAQSGMTVKPESAAAFAAALPGYKLLNSRSATSIPQKQPPQPPHMPARPTMEAPGGGLKPMDRSEGSFVTTANERAPAGSAPQRQMAADEKRHIAAEAAAARAMYNEGGGSTHGGWSGESGGGGSSSGGAGGSSGIVDRSSSSRSKASKDRSSAAPSARGGAQAPSFLGREGGAAPSARKKGGNGGKKEALRVVSPRGKAATSAKVHGHNGAKAGRTAKVAPLPAKVQELLDGQQEA